MWVPLVENNEHLGEGADYFVQKYLQELLQRNEKIDTVLLACTHYPLLREKIERYLPGHIRLLSQGEIVARSLQDYLQRHPEIEKSISRTGSLQFYTTDAPEDFNAKGSLFFGKQVRSLHVDL
jgi:glutamate racemase